MTPIDPSKWPFDRTLLQFSGGKDSMACLFMLLPLGRRLTIHHHNPGAQLPETARQMSALRSWLLTFAADQRPGFHQTASDVQNDIVANGTPADVVPVWSTSLGRMIQEPPPDAIRVRSTFDCCNANLWQPMMKTAQLLRVDCIVRGQRLVDKQRSPIEDGAKAADITIRFPLGSATDEQLAAFLSEQYHQHPAAPPVWSVRAGLSASFDCWCCTGHAQHSEEQRAYLRKTMPFEASIVEGRMSKIRAAVRAQSAYMYKPTEKA